MLGQDMAPITQEMAIASLLSLCLTACDRFPLQLQAIGNSICDDDTINFPLWLKAIVDCKDTQGRQVCPIIVKLIVRMLISMMKANCTYNTESLKSLMDSLSTASETILDLDSSWVFTNTSHLANMIMPNKYLGSLMKEAQDLLDARVGRTGDSTSHHQNQGPVGNQGTIGMVALEISQTNSI